MRFFDSVRHGRSLMAMMSASLRLPLLRAGLDLGLFESLREPCTTLELVSRHELAPDLAEAFLRTAWHQGLLSKQGDRYGLSAFTRWILDSPDSAALVALLDQADLTYAARLRELPALIAGAERPEYGTREEATRAALGARSLERQAIRALTRVPGVKRSRAILDIGCGEGHYLAGLLARYRDAHGVGIELDPHVAEKARQTLRDAQVTRRAEVRVGDFRSLDLHAGSHDLVLLNNNLHYFSPGDWCDLFTRARRQLGPGGVIAVQTPLVPEGGLARRLGLGAMLASFDLFLRSHRNLHGLPGAAAVEAALLDAGFGRVGRVPVIPGGGQCFVWAQLPGQPGGPGED